MHKKEFNGIPIRYEDSGEGFPVVMLHGYLESLNIWDDFACKLSEKYRVITIDIPGHGESGVIGEVHSMDKMAEMLNKVLDELGIKKCVLIGHSMGGYVTLAFLEHHPEKLAGFSLFHSKPQADSEEAANNRERQIHLIDEGKKEAVYNSGVPVRFADDNLQSLSDEVAYAKKMAFDMPDEGVKALLRGMKERPDREKLLEKTNLPFLFILGKKDNLIPYPDILDDTALPANTQIEVLENSGHMGFIEEPKESLQIISNFVDSVKE